MNIDSQMNKNYSDIKAQILGVNCTMKIGFSKSYMTKNKKNKLKTTT